MKEKESIESILSPILEAMKKYGIKSLYHVISQILKVSI